MGSKTLHHIAGIHFHENYEKALSEFHSILILYKKARF